MEVNRRIEIAKGQLSQFYSSKNAFVFDMKLSFADSIFINTRKGGMITLPYIFI